MRRRDEFEAKWRGEEPEAVATLLRNFDKTIALECPNRSPRRMVRNAVLFHSDLGLEVRVFLTLLQADEMLISQGDGWLKVLDDELVAA